jgi:hypothetical protein
MSNRRVGVRTKQADYGSTGDALAQGFFTTDPWSSSSSEGETQKQTLILSGLSSSSEETSSEDFDETFGIQIRSLEQRLARLEKLIDIATRNDIGEENFEEIQESDDDSSFEEWLAEWKAEQPEAYVSKDELSQEIANYEKKYGMSSDELLRRIQEGTAPENSEIMDWKILLEWV